MTIDEAYKYLKYSIYTVVGSLKTEVWQTKEPVSFVNRYRGEHRTLFTGDKWGSLFDSAWFHFLGKLPETGDFTIFVLLIDINGELMLVDENGDPLRGLTNKSSLFDRTLGEPVKRVFRLPCTVNPGDSFEYWADAGCNDLFGEIQENGTLKQADIAVCREDIRSLYYDFEFLINWMENISKEDPLYENIKSTLQKTSEGISDLTEGTIARAGKALKNIFLHLSLSDKFKITAIGHSHLDLAWLWPVRETRRKIGRTLSTVIELMKRYPDYVYGISQPQLLQWVKEDFPVLFSKVKEKIKEGRIEVLGAMWVESDTNLPSGESLIRQIIYGKKFWREEFSLEVDNLWLPDVFGYSGSLPQILKQTGIKYFSTMKLSWNTINKFPYHSFVWNGIDGSSVLVHMLPEGTYNSPAGPGAVLKIVDKYCEKNISSYALMAFGIGDGGGGPGAEHLERLKRMTYTSDPERVRQGKVSEFFADWAPESEKFPIWKGELYLEKHQGTYTTESLSKLYNRKMEMSLRKMEFISVLSMLYNGQNYPAFRLEELWKEVLLYQFHDILPGSSIKRVYDESWKRYSTMLTETELCIQEAEINIIQLAGFEVEESDNTNNEDLIILALNYLSWEIRKWIFLNDQWIRLTIPSMGYAIYKIEETALPLYDLYCDATIMENAIVRIQFNVDGSIYSILDKENNYEVLAVGLNGNIITVYQDRGDAWDFPADYRTADAEQMVLSESFVEKNGPELITHQEYTYGESILRQDIVLRDGDRRIDFRTKISWSKPAKMLRTSFPVNVPSGKAFCEIQFGAIERPVQSKTSWDAAKDEVSAHSWVDISNKSYGVSLLNDSKYGHRVKDRMLDLCLLRSVPYPGPVKGYTDLGEHAFTYSLFPHAGGFGEGGVVHAAHELNLSPSIYKIKHTDKNYYRSFFSTGDYSLIISTVKRAENSDGVILRLYESSGKRVSSWLKSDMFNPQFPYPVKATLVNLLEEFLNSLEIIHGRIMLKAKPYELISIRLSFIN